MTAEIGMGLFHSTDGDGLGSENVDRNVRIGRGGAWGPGLILRSQLDTGGDDNVSDRSEITGHRKRGLSPIDDGVRFLGPQITGHEQAAQADADEACKKNTNLPGVRHNEWSDSR